MSPNSTIATNAVKVLKSVPPDLRTLVIVSAFVAGLWCWFAEPQMSAITERLDAELSRTVQYLHECQQRGDAVAGRLDDCLAALKALEIEPAPE